MTLTLKLSETPDGQSGQALLRLPLDKMQDAGLNAGDTVAVHINQQTHARVMPDDPIHQTARCAANLATNAGGSIGEIATISRVSLPPLKDVILQLPDNTYCKPDDLREALFDIPLTQGDRLTLGFQGQA